MCSFALPGCGLTYPGLGKLPLPEAKLQADRLFRNWTAISADDTLKIISSHTAAAAATPLEFSQNWGESKAPQLVLPESRLIGQHPIIEIQLDEPLPKVEQTIAWSISNAAAIWYFPQRSRTCLRCT